MSTLTYSNADRWRPKGNELMLPVLLVIAGYSFEAPPVEFAFTPDPLPVVRHVSEAIVSIMCGKVEGRHVLGCTLMSDPPVVFIREGLPPELDAAVLEHVNGWKH